MITFSESNLIHILNFLVDRISLKKSNPFYFPFFLRGLNFCLFNYFPLIILNLTYLLSFILQIIQTKYYLDAVNIPLAVLVFNQGLSFSMKKGLKNSNFQNL